jgi:hypothetical protein
MTGGLEPEKGTHAWRMWQWRRDHLIDRRGDGMTCRYCGSTEHAPDMPQIVCVERLAAEIARLNTDLAHAQREYEGPMAEEIVIRMRSTAELVQKIVERQAHLAAKDAEIDLLLADREGLAITIDALRAEQAEDRAAIRFLRERNGRYSEVITILVECDHGDEDACGCRDRAQAIVHSIPIVVPEHKAAIQRAEGRG